MFPQAYDVGGKEGERFMLVPTPGLELFLDAGSNKCRGLYTTSTGVVFAVFGGVVYRVNSNGSTVAVGSIATGDGLLSFADNGTTAACCDGLNAYHWPINGTGVTAFTVEASSIAFIDGYYILSKPQTGQFYVSDLYGTGIDESDIATAEGSPDPTVSMVSSRRELWQFGTKSVEVWYNSGDPDFPFSRIQGAFIDIGCAATYSVCRLNNTVIWLAQDDRGGGTVMMANGYSPQPVNSTALSIYLNSITESQLSAATAYTYVNDGHGFYCLTAGDRTWVFDMATGLWHERLYLNDAGLFEQHLTNCHAYAFGKHLCGSRLDGKIYELSNTTYTDNGAEIKRLRQTPHMQQGMNRLFFSSFQLDMETGVGIDGTGQGTDPRVMLQYSNDGGHSWSDERWVSPGKIGEYLTRARWTQLGSGRSRVWRVAITDPVKFVLMGAEVQAMAGVD
jgi:hypothetical protein